VQPFWISELRHAASQSRDHRLTHAVAGYLTGTLLARRSAFETVGFFDTALQYGDAMDWFTRAAERGLSIKLIPDVLLYHRVHQNNFSRSNGSASRNEFLHILKASLDRRRHESKGVAALYEFSRLD
jgi:GT2 family glycosyltransferase